MAPSVLLVHKVPATWESEARADSGNVNFLEDNIAELSEISSEETTLLENLEKDIFFILSKSISQYLDFSRVNVLLGFDKKEVRNWDVISREGKIDFGNNLVFWSTGSSKYIPKIDNIDIIIFRGNYPNFHNQLINLIKPKITIFYPATSLFFPNFKNRLKSLIPLSSRGSLPDKEINYYLQHLSSNSTFSILDCPERLDGTTDNSFRREFNKYLESCIKISDKIREKESPGNYDIVLYDEEENLPSLRKKYPHSTLLKFNKAASPNFYFDIKAIRKYDLIFSGTTIQKTKNHELFYSILDFLLEESPALNVAIVGVEGGHDNLRKRWPESNVDIYGRVGKNKLRELFNNSRFHVITSGRDCFPRTIPESLVCGCHILALDILSDGLSVLRNNPMLGTVIETSADRISLQPSYNISIDKLSTSANLQIQSEIDIKRDHLLISSLANEIFSTDRMIQLDIIWQQIDLTLT